MYNLQQQICFEKNVIVPTLNIYILVKYKKCKRGVESPALCMTTIHGDHLPTISVQYKSIALPGQEETSQVNII